jgi:hypothetical protein
MTHTPGPWTVDYDTLDVLAVAIGDAPAYIACQPAYQSGRPLDEEEIMANLRLICAAPEMLGFLHQIADECKRRLRKGKDSGDLMTLQLCRAAISKAEGRE